ncbi:unnamed protein product, partial [Protopolystoma xenopodis]
MTDRGWLRTTRIFKGRVDNPPTASQRLNVAQLLRIQKNNPSALDKFLKGLMTLSVIPESEAPQSDREKNVIDNDALSETEKAEEDLVNMDIPYKAALRPSALRQSAMIRGVGGSIPCTKEDLTKPEEGTAKQFMDKNGTKKTPICRTDYTDTQTTLRVTRAPSLGNGYSLTGRQVEETLAEKEAANLSRNAYTPKPRNCTPTSQESISASHPIKGAKPKVKSFRRFVNRSAAEQQSNSTSHLESNEFLAVQPMKSDSSPQ